MLHNPALEASYVTTYVQDYLDGLENLPNLIQPHISEIKRLDVENTGIWFWYIWLNAECNNSIYEVLLFKPLKYMSVFQFLIIKAVNF